MLVASSYAETSWMLDLVVDYTMDDDYSLLPWVGYLEIITQLEFTIIVIRLQYT